MTPDIDVREMVWSELQDQIEAVQSAMQEAGVHFAEARTEFESERYGEVDLFDDAGEMIPSTSLKLRSPNLVKIVPNSAKEETIFRKDWGTSVGLEIAAARLLDNVSDFVKQTSETDISAVNLDIPADGEFRIRTSRVVENDWSPEAAGIDMNAAPALGR